jgi:hypothetical protein
LPLLPHSLLPADYSLSHWGRQESNLHGLPHWNLNPARLPISPRPRAPAAHQDASGWLKYSPIGPEWAVGQSLERGVSVVFRGQTHVDGDRANASCPLGLELQFRRFAI